MSFLGKFKKKKDAAPASSNEADKNPVKKDEKPVEAQAEKSTKEERKVDSHGEKQDTKKKDSTKVSKHDEKGVAPVVHRVLLRQVISEKSAHLHDYNQYVFIVNQSSNKIEIKKAIKALYKKEPIEVRVMRIHGKTVQRGKIKGRTSDYKKAIVRMPKGVELPVYEDV
jgi:large subunit ribosomal protein L23